MTLNQKILTEFRAALVGADIIVMLASWLLAYYFRFHSFLTTPKGIPDFHLYLKLMPFLLLIWLFTSFFTGFYRRSLQRRSAVKEALDIMQVTVAQVVAFTAFTALYEEYRYSRLTLVLFLLFMTIGLITGRSLLRKVLRYFLRRIPKRKSLLIGGGRLYQEVKKRLNEPDHEYQLAYELCLDEITDAKLVKAHPPLPKDWSDYLRQHPVDTVFVIFEANTHFQLKNQIADIANQVPDIKIVPDVLQISKFSPRLESTLGLPAISIHESPLAGPGRAMKRMIDIFGAAFALLLFSPIIFLLTLIIKTSSKGPVLYRQERLGLDGQTFWMLKFRSMAVDSEAQTGAVFAKKHDQRTTWIGKWMRRTSLDELPQFVNVLRGEMSLVGPRPERPVFVHQFRKEIPGYMLRHKVKAGVTGWAQVNGWRGDTSIEKRIECDLFYIQNWSLWLDCKILVYTVLRGFIHKNAY